MAKRKKPEAEEAPAVERTTEAPTMSKMDAVRAALQDGVDKPADGVSYLRDRHGLEITAQMFSSYKSKLVKDGDNGKGKAEGNGKGRGETEGRRVGNRTQGNAGDVAGSLETIKALVEKLGSDQVIRIAKLFDN